MLRLIALMFALFLDGCSTPHSPPPYYPAAQYGTAVALDRSVWLFEPYSWITPLEVLEDSRCPSNVQCVWAGQVRILARVTKDNKPDRDYIVSTDPYEILSFEQEFTVGKPIFLFGGEITLRGVTPPSARQGEKIALEDYRFTFSFGPQDGGS